MPVTVMSDMGKADDCKMKALLSVNVHQVGSRTQECTTLKRNQAIKNKFGID